MDIDYCKFCNDELFSITNVKFKVGFICQIIIDVDNSGVLNSQYSNINIIHYDNYSYTVFNGRKYEVHITGCKCMCMINDAIGCLKRISNYSLSDVNFIRIDSISITLNVKKFAKNRLMGLNNNPETDFIIRQPVLFPGTIIKKKNCKASISIFNSGKGVGCGFKRYGQIVSLVNDVHYIINDLTINE